LLKLTNGKTHEILRAKPIFLQVQDHSEKQVKQLIATWLLKLSSSIGDMLHNDADRLTTLVEDLMDVYPYDSLEDIRECLKKGRRGDYGFGHHKRGFITMLLLREWMSRHLEEKAIIREKEIERNKVDLKDVENFDAKRFYKEGAKFLAAQAEREKQKKHEGFNQRHYQEHKLAYLQSRKKANDRKDGAGSEG
jgi:hypothetical protein